MVFSRSTFLFDSMNDFSKPTVSTFRFFNLFDALELDKIEELCKSSKLRHYKRGHTLYRQGDMNDTMYFILSGALIYTRDIAQQDGCIELNDVVVQVFGQGEAIGDGWALEPTFFRGNVKSLQDTTLLVVDRSEFARLASSNLAVVTCLYKRSAMKMFKIVEGIDIAYGKLLKRIEVLASECEKVGINLNKHFSKADIARMLGVSRVAVSQSLNGKETPTSLDMEG